VLLIRRVGAALLRGEWKGAVDLILQGTPHEKDDIRAARDKYTKDGDAKVGSDGDAKVGAG
jgi:tRNA(Glu) U13 pseudouridine synthase TruD